MADVTQSFSQLLRTYGPGAMLDMPEHAVVVAGLQGWRYGAGLRSIAEERLVPLLRDQLTLGSEFEGLRAPPEYDEERHDPDAPGVDVLVFPGWFTVDDGDVAPAGAGAPDGSGETRRRLVEFNNLYATKAGKLTYDDNGKKRDVNPVRFVAACQKGHLQDIDWRFLVHRNADRSCRKAMFWIERGVSSDPSDISVRCTCGAQVTMADLYKPKFLGICHAHSPWLQPRRLDSESCDKDLRLLPRSATNTYFAQTVTVISLTRTDDRVRQKLDEHRATVDAIKALPNFIDILRSLPATRDAFVEFTDADILRALEASASSRAPVAQNPKLAEFDLLASGGATIGTDEPGSFFFAETLDRAVLDLTAPWSEFLRGIVKVGRLREVMCLYGFTRLEPPPSAAETDLEEIHLVVDGARLAREVRWLPALEQFGEGIFLHVDPAYMHAWLARSAVAAYSRQLREAEIAEAEHFARKAQNLGAAYWALHSLSHALMGELALECGYPLSSLKERIYASREGQADRYGILIYTSTAGGQGTLGGLSEMASSIPRLLARTIVELQLCSNDPICADHEVASDHDERPLHGAACHSCLLVPETSCELRNTRLDRGLLVRTLVEGNHALFNP